MNSEVLLEILEPSQVSITDLSKQLVVHIVVAMYHDQGHGPIKVLGLESGVNITVGLPVIRTSVDHGTAFDIAGKGIADEMSMIG